MRWIPTIGWVLFAAASAIWIANYFGWLHPA